MTPVTREAAVARFQPKRPPATLVGPSHVAWLATVPACLVAVAASWLATGLAESIMPRASWRAFLSLGRSGLIRPEPIDQLRYLVSLAAPLMVIGPAYLTWKQTAGRTRRRRFDSIVIAVQVTGLVLVGVCWIVQRSYLRWFSGWSLLFALGVACLLLVVARTTGVFVSPGARASRRVWRGLGLGVAVAASGSWLLPSVFSDSNLAGAPFGVAYHLQFTFDDFLALLNGRTPLVDSIPLYGRLLPFALEPVLRIFGPTVGTFTWTMWALSIVAFVAVYLMFRVVTGNPLWALALYVPFLSVSMLSMIRVGDQRLFLANLYGVVPLRVVGPFLLAWLCARQLRRPRRGGAFALFLLAALAVINSPDFGLASLLGVFVALWCGSAESAPTLRLARTYLVQALLAALAAAALVCALTLVRTSSLPRWDYLNHFQRVFGLEGFGMVPMPLLGLHVIIYLTYLAALVGAIMTSVRGHPLNDTVLTGMLAYSGVLGLGSLPYWVGRSTPSGLVATFPPWGLCLSLLAWWVLTAVSRRSVMKWSTVGLWALPCLAVLTAFGLTVSTVSKLPSPAREVERITSKADPAIEDPYLFDRQGTFNRSAVRFVADHTAPGERVGILASLGHGIAKRAGVVNVSPYAHPESIGFDEQMALALGAIERSGGKKIFLGNTTYAEISEYLTRSGYVAIAYDAESGLSLFSRDGP